MFAVFLFFTFHSILEVVMNLPKGKMIRWFGLVFVFTLISYLSSPICLYASGPWTSGASTLKQYLGARPLGMGEAFVGLADDINTLQFNPAGLSNIPRREIGAMYLKGLVDTNYGNVTYAQSLGERGYIGGSLMTLQGGDIEINWWDGTSVTTDKRKAKQDYIFTLGYARDFLNKRKLSIGVNFKVIKSELAEESYGNSFAVDVGGLYRFMDEKLSLGLSIQNVGKGMKYKGGIATGEENDPLPLAIKLGIAYKFISDDISKLTGVLDITKYRYTDIQTNAGIEYWLKDMIALRGGYKIGYDLDTFTGGVGVKYKDYQLDYGFGLMDKINHLHKVSFTLRFGNPSPKQISRAEQIHNKGLTYFDVEEYARAILEFNKTIKINPNYEDAQVKMRESYTKLTEQTYQQGLNCYDKSQYARAILLFNQVLELDPLHEDAHAAMIEANEMLKQ